MLPNFFIVGTAKAGTTSLYHYLEDHPEVYMCPIKEPNFFSYEEICRQSLYYKERGVGDRLEYENLFTGARNKKAIGEASVSYLFYPATATKIRKTCPKAKIIILVRDPIDRAFFHYLMDTRLGYIDLSFEDIVFKKGSHHLLELYWQQYIGLSFYYDQVKRYLDIFGEEQVKVLLNEDLRENAFRVVLSVYEFLGINNSILPDSERQHNVYQKPRNVLVRQLYSVNPLRTLAKAIIPARLVESVKDTLLVREEKPELSENTRKYLASLFADDTLKLQKLINRDLSTWYKMDG
ncbi:MAG: hypothetical protein BBJ57_13325 [Desulfobacterales bacterium PC51MH44]|nr:MAG: hypothetical protein BBJ57_13325 [Desulfobacterales bacterium PC51MH44]